MSADDSIEIEFPSLKQPAPKPPQRGSASRAPGPIEAQLSKASESDDLSWLTAIFADDELETDEDATVVDPDGSPSYEIDSDGAEADDHAAVVALLAESDRDDSLPPGAPPQDTGLPPPSLPPVARSADTEVEAPGITAPASGTEAAESEPGVPERVTAGQEPADGRPAKQASGFREEIMSTFSQMYN